jgi:hypothetical protein
MVNKEPMADTGSGMDFNTGQETVDMRQKASQKSELLPPEKM